MNFQEEDCMCKGPGVSEPGKFEKLNKDQTGWIAVSERAHGIR